MTDALRDTMYAIFRETDAKRDKLEAQFEQIADVTQVSTATVCYIAGTLLWNRIHEAGSAEELRGYITEFITVLAMARLDLDRALGVTANGSEEAGEIRQS